MGIPELKLQLSIVQNACKTKIRYVGALPPSIWRILDFPAYEVQQLEGVMMMLAALSTSAGLLSASIR
jgi:hypothetical protein